MCFVSVKVGELFCFESRWQPRLIGYHFCPDPTHIHRPLALHVAGDVHVWDRETAALLWYLRPMNIPELRDMTCIGWNDGTDEPMMFATGSHDGTVRVWSTDMVYRADDEGSSTEVESDD